jgi:5-methylcytosine-specific restriction endonuclease McrA
MWNSEEERLAEYDKTLQRMPATLIRRRDMGECFYCGRPVFRMGPASVSPAKYTRDHVKAKSKTEVGVARTTVTCCNQCNADKRTMGPVRFVRRFYPGRIGKIDWASVGISGIGKDPLEVAR